MKIGIIGTGRVCYSMGKYMQDHGIRVTGFYDRHRERALDAAQFTGTDSFDRIEDLVAASDTLFLTTSDGEIANVWDCIRHLSIQGKIICHFSGSLSSDQFQGIEKTRAYGLSIHPMLAFSDKYTSYKQLQNAFFTLEGHAQALAVMEPLLQKMGNPVQRIAPEQKALYHAAAATLSNQVVALLASGYEMLEACGFDTENARRASAALVRGNVENVIASGCVQALTGPIERGDLVTVEKHLQVIPAQGKEMYMALAREQIRLAKKKNPHRDYTDMECLLADEKRRRQNNEEYGRNI